MKVQHDPRHQKRREIVQMLFADTFTTQHNISDPELIEIISKKSDLDTVIQEAAPAWPIDKINKIDLAILRLSVYELQSGKTPPKVVIDEAVELAKEFGAESSPSFVNGVLGTIFNAPEENLDNGTKN